MGGPSPSLIAFLAVVVVAVVDDDAIAPTDSCRVESSKDKQRQAKESRVE